MRTWIAIGLGIVVLTAIFVVAQSDRNRSGANGTTALENQPDAGDVRETSASQPQPVESRETMPVGPAGSSAIVPEPQTSSPIADAEITPSLDEGERNERRASANDQIRQVQPAGAGSGAPAALPSGSAPAIENTSQIPPDATSPLAVGETPEVVGPLPGEGEPLDTGMPLPGENEPEAYGLLPGEGEPPPAGPLPGEGQPDSTGPLPGE